MAALLLVQTIGERGGGGLVDESQNFEAGDAAGVFGGLALRVVEICGDCDDGTRDRFAEMLFRPGFQLAQNLRRDSGAVKSFSPRRTRMTLLLASSILNGKRASSS